MISNIVALPPFEKELKHLAKKFPSVKNDIADLVNDLQIDPMLGTPLGNDCYKIRIAIKSKGKGKSGGARLITHVQVTKETIYLIAIYDKSETANITDTVLFKRLERL